MSFEDNFIRGLDFNKVRPRSLDTVVPSPIELAHHQAQKLLSNPEYAIQADTFADLYGKENVDRDRAAVAEKRARILREQTPEMDRARRASEVFEALVLEQAELSNWLGRNVGILKTSTYDDYFNGSDLIAEWQDTEREPNVLALAVDVTFGARTVENKLMHIRRQVDKGELGTIKYFRSGDGAFRGERRGVPQAVLGVSKDGVQELARLWLARDKKALANHPVQRVIIEELWTQLDTIHAYAEKRGQSKSAEAYRRALAVVSAIRDEKNTVPLLHFKDDRVFQEIMTQPRAIFRA
ncbi:MAG TPA: hypothetical protein VN495_01070 [Candidatus Paceibacterota bacterium]|nr:hypothetical protein [Candidatus Paceibacterota bacterium]